MRRTVRSVRAFSKPLAMALGAIAMMIGGWGLYGSFGWLVFPIAVGVAVPPALMYYVVRKNMKPKRET